MDAISELFLRGIKLTKPSQWGENEGDYVFDLPIIHNLSQLEFSKNVTFFVGENGAGKSTLLEAIAVTCGFNAEGGSRNFNFATAETHSPLHEHLTPVRGIRRPKDGFFLRAESFYNVATQIEALDDGGGGPRLVDSYGGVSLHEQSHGESFLTLMLERFGGNGLYLLDEPEAALSPMRQMAILTRMHDLVKSGSQLIIATHSPILLAYPDAEIYVFQHGRIELVPYEETEHYIVTRKFLNDYEGMLRILLAEG